MKHSKDRRLFAHDQIAVLDIGRAVTTVFHDREAWFDSMSQEMKKNYFVRFASQAADGVLRYGNSGSWFVYSGTPHAERFEILGDLEHPGEFSRYLVSGRVVDAR